MAGSIGGFGISCDSICPAFVSTGMTCWSASPTFCVTVWLACASSRSYSIFTSGSGVSRSSILFPIVAAAAPTTWFIVSP